VAKIIQIIDVDPEGFRVRLDDGSCATLDHNAGWSPTVGDEIPKVNAEPGSAEPAPNLTDKQWELLGVLVSGHESNGGAEFYFGCNVGGCGITYPGGRAVPGSYDETDLLQLRSERLVHITCPQRNLHRGKPTQSGITAVRQRLISAAKGAFESSEPSPQALESPMNGHKKRIRYEFKLPLLNPKSAERVAQRAKECDKQLGPDLDYAEAYLREHDVTLGERATLEEITSATASRQELTVLRKKIVGLAVNAAAESVRELADCLLLAQNRLGVHADCLREYTARIIAELRGILMASPVFDAAPLLPWCEDPITQKAMLTCEEMLLERWKIGDGCPYGGGDLNGDNLKWPDVVQSWEAYKAAHKIEGVGRERIPESVLRSILAQQRHTEPHEVTDDQIYNAGRDLGRHYGVMIIIPLALECNDTPRPLPASPATTQFWREREEEFRRHDTPANCALLAEWSLPDDHWEFRAGAISEGPNQHSEQVFKALAREAATGLAGTRSVEPWEDWLHALRRAADKYTGRLFYSKVSCNGSCSMGDGWIARMTQMGQSIPQGGLIQFVAFVRDEDDAQSGRRGSVDTFAIEKRTFWDTRTERIEQLFTSSANYCLELRSLVPQNQPAAAEMVKTPSEEKMIQNPPASELPNTSTRRSGRRGPVPDFETPSRVAAIVARVAPDGDWRLKLDEVCEALDDEEIACPKTWQKKQPPCRSWSGCLDRPLVIKAIDYRLERARPPRKTTPESFS
jgi:hypothetical protein